MPKVKWKKAYVGPFDQDEAYAYAMYFKMHANPDLNGIYDAKIRKRKFISKYDVYIRTYD